MMIWSPSTHTSEENVVRLHIRWSRLWGTKYEVEQQLEACSNKRQEERKNLQLYLAIVT